MRQEIQRVDRSVQGPNMGWISNESTDLIWVKRSNLGQESNESRDPIRAKRSNQSRSIELRDPRGVKRSNDSRGLLPFHSLDLSTRWNHRHVVLQAQNGSPSSRATWTIWERERCLEQSSCIRDISINHEMRPSKRAAGSPRLTSRFSR